MANVQDFKKSINDSSFTDEQIAIIWDFYVTKSISASASQKRKITDYGHKKIPFDKMMEIALITNDKLHAVMADRIPQTLANLDLQLSDKKPSINIDICRAAYIIPYQKEDNVLKPKISKPEAFLSHIRNAFAHGNTYFFDNGNVLLEDKKQKITTAMILLRQKTLLDWISLIDKDHKYYVVQKSNK